MQSSNINAKNNCSTCGISAFGLIKSYGVVGGRCRGTKGGRISGPESMDKDTRTRHPENKCLFVPGQGRCSIRVIAGKGRGKKKRQAQKHIEKWVRLEQSCQPSPTIALKFN